MCVEVDGGPWTPGAMAAVADRRPRPISAYMNACSPEIARKSFDLCRHFILHYDAVLFPLIPIYFRS